MVYTYAGIKVTAVFTVVTLLLLLLFSLLGLKLPKTALVVLIIYGLLLGGVTTVGHKTTQSLSKIESKTEYETVQVVALKNRGFTAETDISAFHIGYIEGESGAYKKCASVLEANDRHVKKTKPYKDAESIYYDMVNWNTELMLLTSMARSEMEEINPDYMDEFDVLFEEKVPLDEVKAKHVDVAKEPFVIYLQGADLSGGDIHSTGRGDANFLLTINPETKKVNFQVIPRDTFVKIPSMGGRSKLSWSGWWGGVQSSIKSIEDKFGIDINYYAKINFDGVIGLVDALGGVEVESRYNFSGDGYYFSKGTNYIESGAEALAFVRERKSLPENELSRGKNQMAMIKAIINKFAKEPTYDHAMALLDCISDSFVTNIPQKDYLKTFNVMVSVLPELQSMEMKSMKGEMKWHDDEIRPDWHKYYFYPAEGEVERVRNDIDKIKKGK